MNLATFVDQAALADPTRLAVVSEEGCLTYGALLEYRNRFATLLQENGVRLGDRVGIWLEKSLGAVAAFQAVLACGAAYVPVNPQASSATAAAILGDCAVRLVLTTDSRRSTLPDTSLHCISAATAKLSDWDAILPATSTASPVAEVDADQLAYILYTSGSTGKPKGICLSHRNAEAFVRWAADVLKATPDDRFANHAPLNFDLSVLDLYAAFASGASVHLVPESLSYSPSNLVDWIAESGITVWYSVPSALLLMMEHGRLPERESFPWRAVLFAGETFPMPAFRRLRAVFPSARFLNLYGPTETNVCTYYEAHADLPPDMTSLPIGSACCGDRAWALNSDGQEAQVGEEGELWISGPTVMLGYWGRPAQGDATYATGDMVRVRADGRFDFLGRKDRLVKVRGMRIELDAVENVLRSHPGIAAAAAIAAGEGLERTVVGFVRPTLPQAETLALDMKRHCARFMTPGLAIAVRIVEQLPTTPTGKVDYLALARLSAVC